MNAITSGSFIIIMILFVTVTGCMTKACIEPFFHYVVNGDDTCPDHKAYHYDMNYHISQNTGKDRTYGDGYKDWKPHKMPKEDKGIKQPIRRRKTEKARRRDGR